MKRRGILVAALLVGALVPAPATGDRMPVLAYGQEVPRDLRLLAARTWTRFLETFPARAACMPDVRLLGARRLSGRAEYRPLPPTIVVRIPATAAQLEAALVHEFAHHLEFSCAGDEDLRRAFLEAEGMPADHPWFAAASWERTPSERFAEAAVEIVLGRRSLHRTLFISEQAHGLVRAWGLGRPILEAHPARSVRAPDPAGSNVGSSPGTEDET